LGTGANQDAFNVPNAIDLNATTIMMENNIEMISTENSEDNFLTLYWMGV
jgi:hypothetical protein